MEPNTALVVAGCLIVAILTWHVLRVRELRDSVEFFRASREECDNARDRMRDERDGWQRTAREYANGLEYYRGELSKIAQLFGDEAYICDDGSRSQDILIAKTFDLVDKLIASKEAYVKTTRDSDNAVMGKLCGGLKERDLPSRGLLRDIDMLFSEIDRLRGELRESQAAYQKFRDATLSAKPGQTHVGEAEWVDLYAVHLNSLDNCLRAAIAAQKDSEKLSQLAEQTWEKHRRAGELLTALDEQMTAVAKKLGHLDEPPPASEVLTDRKR